MKKKKVFPLRLLPESAQHQIIKRLRYVPLLAYSFLSAKSKAQVQSLNRNLPALQSLFKTIGKYQFYTETEEEAFDTGAIQRLVPEWTDIEFPNASHDYGQTLIDVFLPHVKNVVIRNPEDVQELPVFPQEIGIHNFDELRLFNKYSLTLDDVLIMNPTCVVLHELSLKDANRFIKLWMKGLNMRTKKMYICTKEDLNEEILMRGVPYQVLPVEEVEGSDDARDEYSDVSRDENDDEDNEGDTDVHRDGNDGYDEDAKDEEENDHGQVHDNDDDENENDEDEEDSDNEENADDEEENDHDRDHNNKNENDDDEEEANFVHAGAIRRIGIKNKEGVSATIQMKGWNTDPNVFSITMGHH